MKSVLVVEETFAVSGRGLVLAPDMPFPFIGFKEFSASVVIEQPNGSILQAEANFVLSHFKPGGYKLMVVLPSEGKQNVPVGSRILASEDVHKRLLGTTA